MPPRDARVPASGREEAQRREMITRFVATRGVDDPRVLAAMQEVPRHLFVPGPLRSQAYGDHSLPIGYGQTISQPYVVGVMTQRLGSDPETFQPARANGRQEWHNSCREAPDRRGSVDSRSRVKSATVRFRRKSAAVPRSHFLYDDPSLRRTTQTVRARILTSSQKEMFWTYRRSYSIHWWKSPAERSWRHTCQKPVIPGRTASRASRQGTHT